MRTISIEIELGNVDDWDVNWDNPDICVLELTGLNRDILSLLSNNLGIPYDSIQLKTSLENGH
jgi:sporulation protein YlmC with PRC-barrel domain